MKMPKSYLSPENEFLTSNLVVKKTCNIFHIFLGFIYRNLAQNSYFYSIAHGGMGQKQGLNCPAKSMIIVVILNQG